MTYRYWLGFQIQLLAAPMSFEPVIIDTEKDMEIVGAYLPSKSAFN